MNSSSQQNSIVEQTVIEKSQNDELELTKQCLELKETECILLNQRVEQLEREVVMLRERIDKRNEKQRLSNLSSTSRVVDLEI